MTRPRQSKPTKPKGPVRQLPEKNSGSFLVTPCVLALPCGRAVIPTPMHAIQAPDHTRQTMLRRMYLVDLLNVVPCGRSKITRTIQINNIFIKKTYTNISFKKNCKHYSKV
ncbi:hypothetical protein HanRHA438_Chr13g0586391 [Helianthus annuus]|nr:hypothetical protein HanIR_Chr13g0626481 [Helianthus annuus]KAJ0857121.1 hypothetical protein HanRHA438_Chr13g0586391 [Helianthus annuus]